MLFRWITPGVAKRGVVSFSLTENLMINEQDLTEIILPNFIHHHYIEVVLGYIFFFFINFNRITAFLRNI